MRKAYLAMSILCAAALFAGPVADAARACTIDGKPSMAANGHDAVLNHTLVTPKSYPTWAPFTFNKPFAVNRPVTLSEDRATLKNVMLPEAFSRPWCWTFGDGGTATGATVSHTYKGPGHYRIVVYAYFPSYANGKYGPCSDILNPNPKVKAKMVGWLNFDTVSLTVAA